MIIIIVNFLSAAVNSNSGALRMTVHPVVCMVEYAAVFFPFCFFQPHIRHHFDFRYILFYIFP